MDPAVTASWLDGMNTELVIWFPGAQRNVAFRITTRERVMVRATETRFPVFWMVTLRLEPGPTAELGDLTTTREASMT